jgi:hypothetical protein
MAKLDVDIRQTVTWNFLVQLGLTAVSWAIAFLTSHTTMAKVQPHRTTPHSFDVAGCCFMERPEQTHVVQH